MAMNMTHLLLLGTSSLKTLFHLEYFVICLYVNLTLMISLMKEQSLKHVDQILLTVTSR